MPSVCWQSTEPRDVTQSVACRRIQVVWRGQSNTYDPVTPEWRPPFQLSRSAGQFSQNRRPREACFGLQASFGWGWIDGCPLDTPRELPPRWHNDSAFPFSCFFFAMYAYYSLHSVSLTRAGPTPHLCRFRKSTSTCSGSRAAVHFPDPVKHMTAPVVAHGSQRRADAAPHE